MNTTTQSSETDNNLLMLGIASFFLFPFTAIPGILIGRRQTSMSPRGRVGYRLCWICLSLFCIQLVLVGILILAGGSLH